jgi:hypothetical protein
MRPQGRTYMTMLAFGECDGGLEYQELELAPTISLSREALAAELMDRVKRREASFIRCFDPFYIKAHQLNSKRSSR